MRRAVSTILYLALLQGAIVLPCRAQNAFPKAKVEVVDRSVLLVDGVLVPGVDKEVLDKLAQHEIRFVRIRSGGGATETALNIAEEIYRRNLGVEVLDFCLSSCANYVFVAGKPRVSANYGIVGFHGGHSDNPWDKCSNIECMSSGSFQRLLEREQRLYLIRGVSLNLIVYSGIIARSGYPVEMTGTVGANDSNVWIPDRKTLEAAGVDDDGIYVPGDTDAARKLLLEKGFGQIRPFVGPVTLKLH